MFFYISIQSSSSKGNQYSLKNGYDHWALLNVLDILVSTCSQSLDYSYELCFTEVPSTSGKNFWLQPHDPLLTIKTNPKQKPPSAQRRVYNGALEQSEVESPMAILSPVYTENSSLTTVLLTWRFHQVIVLPREKTPPFSILFFNVFVVYKNVVIFIDISFYSIWFFSWNF